MTPTKSSNSSPWASPRIACYGTAFLVDDSVDLTRVKNGIASEVLHFGSPRLDASFLINCGRFLASKAATMDSIPSTYVRRVAGSDFRSPKAVVLYECSSELRELLAAVTPRRAAELATEWYGMYGAPKSKEAKPKAARRYDWQS
jgi:hypothetical protein